MASEGVVLQTPSCTIISPCYGIPSTVVNLVSNQRYKFLQYIQLKYTLRSDIMLLRGIGGTRSGSTKTTDFFSV